MREFTAVSDKPLSAHLLKMVRHLVPVVTAFAGNDLNVRIGLSYTLHKVPELLLLEAQFGGVVNVSIHHTRDGRRFR
ncbi:MAG: hypothetical protein J6B55_02565 [Clostridia bacterium]|nr:hypothetical protein [Clostridia bacterium]